MALKLQSFHGQWRWVQASAATSVAVPHEHRRKHLELRLALGARSLIVTAARCQSTQSTTRYWWRVLPLANHLACSGARRRIGRLHRAQPGGARIGGAHRHHRSIRTAAVATWKSPRWKRVAGVPWCEIRSNPAISRSKIACFLSV
jgi:hypothetical protein